MKNYRVWLAAMLKGGTRKTTTAMFTAFALAARGERVLVIDADTGTQGVTAWGTRVYAAGLELPFDVVQWSHRAGLLVRFIHDQAEQSGARRVIVDVGGEAPEVLGQAAAVADLVVCPVGPDQAEMDRLPATRDMVRANGSAPIHVLLTRVPKVGQGIATSARDYLETIGYDVLRAEVPHNRAMYDMPYGHVVDNPGEYAAVADELLASEGVTARG